MYEVVAFNLSANKLSKLAGRMAEMRSCGGGSLRDTVRVAVKDHTGGNASEEGAFTLRSTTTRLEWT